MKKSLLITLSALLFTNSVSLGSTPYLGIEGGFVSSQPKEDEVKKTGLDVELKYFQNFQTDNWSFDPGLGLIYLTMDGSSSSRDVSIKTTALDLNLDAKYKITSKMSIGPAYKGLFGTDTTFVEEKEGSSYFNSFVGVKGDYYLGLMSGMPIKAEAGVFESISNRSTMLVNVGIAIGFPTKQEQKINKLNEVVIPKVSQEGRMPVRDIVENQEEVADVKVTLKSARVLFNTDVSQLDPDLAYRIKKLGDYLSKNPGEWGRVKVSGHTDMSGSKEYNQKLSQDRADSVMRELVNSGVNSSKVSAIGYGWTRPLDTANTTEAYSKNRRTEIEFFGVKDKEKFNKILLKILQ